MLKRNFSFLVWFAIATTLGGPVAAQDGKSGEEAAGVSANPLTSQPGRVEANSFLGVPVSTLAPGNVPIKPGLQAPPADNEARERGMRLFDAMNCVGCHAANGGGGMGPALSNNAFIYGDAPEQVFLSIYQGRPHGMPAWGAMLPPESIWDLAAYIKSISRAPSPQWGTTISANSPDIEQTPAEYEKSIDP